MCNFASFVLTKDRELWLDDSDSHSEIIRHYELHEWGSHGPNIIKVEISPTPKIKKWPSLTAWRFVIDQDKLPVWHDAETTEKRARAALQRRYKMGFKTVYASDCTALTKLKADAAEYVDASGCTALTELKADAAKTVDARGCTALTELKADAAEYVDASGCTTLTELKADAAKYVYARGCTALTKLKADAAKTVDASGCTALTKLKADAAKYVYARGCNPKLKTIVSKKCKVVR